MRMDANIKKQWVEALRSGKYEQGSGSLRLENHGTSLHCCLGVLCENVPDDLVKWDDEIEEFYFKKDPVSHENEFIEPILEEVGFDEDVMRHLAKMNDDGKTFLEIADWIEKHL